MRLTPFRVGLGALAATALLNGSALAQCPAADSLEPNDDCLTGTLVTAGQTLTGLTVDGAAATTGQNDDYFEITVPNGEILTIDCLFTHVTTTGDIDLYLYDPATSPACGGEAFGDYLVRGFSASDNEQVTWSNLSGAPVTYIARVEIFGSGGTCNDYDISFTTTPDPCLSAVDDGFEPNDDCASAVPLATGAHTGLFASTTNEDYYTIAVPAGEILTVDVTYVSGANADIDLELFSDLACAVSEDFSFSFGGTGQVEWANGTGAAATAVLRAAPDAATGTCNNYDLNVTVAPDPCLDPLADDAFEDNDDCFTGTVLGDGLYPGLFVSKADEDFYEVTVGDTDTLFVDVFHIAANGDIDVYIYDDQVACGDLSSYLVRGFTGSDDENISWTNTTGATQTYYVQVVIWASDDQDCGNYDLQLTGTGGGFVTATCPGDGTNVACPCSNESALGAGEGCQNSTGVGATIAVTGSNSVAADDISFQIAQAIPGQPSLLVQGSTTISAPFRDGILCAGNPTERVEVVFLDGAGAGTTVSSIVTEGGVSAGDTRNYQFWYRNPGGVSPCGTGSNFTSGVELTYAP